MREKRSVAALKAVGYRQARKPEKTKRLDELVALTQYTRRHARRLMSQQGKQLWLNRRTKLVGDVQKRPRRERARVYDEPVVTVLIKLWKMMDYICGKRLQPALPELISVLAGEGAPLRLGDIEGMVNGGVELELRNGGQPSYWWLLAAE